MPAESEPLPVAVDPIFGIIVVLKCIEADRFIGLGPEGATLVETIPEAMQFDYIKDEIPRTIWDIRHHLGQTWVALPLKPTDFYETCDGCRKLFQVFEIFFDGRQFRCLSTCRKRG